MEIIKTKKEFVMETLQIIIGIIIMNLGFYFFFLPTHLIIGGVTGMSILLEKANLFTNMPVFYSLVIFILNLIFLLIGLIFLGKEFFLKTIFGSLFVPFVLFILELSGIDQHYIINQISEPLRLVIAAVLGSLIVSSGLGLVFRNSGSTGGIDIAQIILNRKYHRSFIFSFLVTDGLVVLAGLFVYQNVELFLFSIGSVILSSIIVDNISIRGRAGQTLFIITNKANEVKQAIYETIERGTTIIDVKGGYSGEVKQLVICVIQTRQLNLTRHVIQQVDKDAFTFIAQTKEAVGYGFTHK